VKRETLRCATSGKGGTGEMGVSFVSCMSRSMTFWVRSSEHLELRTSNRRPSRFSRPPILLVSHAERAEQTQREACAIFADGLTAFLNRAWGQARASFQQCIGFTGKDGPAQFYLTLCDQYLKTPPLRRTLGRRRHVREKIGAGPASSILCARTTRGLGRMRRGAARCPSCSQNAHGETVLVRCAQ